MSAQRSDAQRNYARILAVAEQEVAALGAEVSLEHIARVAGVGSATVRRHFPSKRALLDAVFQEGVEALYDRAVELAAGEDARDALIEWLGALVKYSTSARGMAVALLRDETAADHGHPCDRLIDGGEPLVKRAIEVGAAPAGVTAADLVTLVTGIVLATEHHRDSAAEAERLLAMAVRGIAPQL
ncbi:TetR/AcrR family transcriptional regulator [Streptomyces acidiscabies]|uniref:TetR/AcrR family transcriptional regulator n=1 Tax=Streptomyces acidiscabies TaxID=42234 RepID=A0AAP6EIC0_9ACTN|nr:TetR/AcrR family transcriptional regulator [Streptomyces acidiscabies]MBP5942014.1 TetR/AcrR family transcriptional regulator [Streptomyces sp. LBUM 1476]MBZ3913488.1 TetR/AcrR family transcriptional regulator [Streptomyces acidiscabies]MDX2963321.1 TetR/AcrR family transcriptional regulator [Streptomyces acidiscabies]MDX3023055.1 TetR/AcrR family transcriptional regulator [Streptomyces acidiscabies]MDX3792801.1 TetR/AcrR family transcriptional regulator [Streptomyces acidiscabies]